MAQFQIGILGARSPVGFYLIPHLVRAAQSFACFTRKPVSDIESRFRDPGVSWLQIDELMSKSDEIKIDSIISMAPIWSLPDYFKFFEKTGIRRIIAVSSTSRFTKSESSSEAEKKISGQLIYGETQLQSWAEANGVEWVILRPTIIYDGHLDKNVTEIMRFIRRFLFFPIFGSARGLRQPIHSEDVGLACLQALSSPNVKNKAYNIAGNEVLTYREMIERIFKSLGRPALLIPVPLSFFSFAVSVVRLIPRYRRWTTAMAERMNSDLVFDNSEARRDFRFSPRSFSPHPSKVD